MITVDSECVDHHDCERSRLRQRNSSCFGISDVARERIQGEPNDANWREPLYSRRELRSIDCRVSWT